MADQANNPSYVTLASQLSGVQSDIESAKRQIAELEKRREDYVRRTEAGPRVEETYKALMAERTNTETKYQDMMKRVMEAKVSQGLEKEQMGEKFTLIDPARLPEKPVKPNVPAVLLIGLFLGIGAGVGNVSLKESGDQSVRSAGQLTGATGYPVLGAIPRIVNEEDRRRSRAVRRRMLIAVVRRRRGNGASLPFLCDGPGCCSGRGSQDGLCCSLHDKHYVKEGRYTCEPIGTR